MYTGLSPGGDSGGSNPTREINCSKTLWLLTTNRFDDDIIVFNDKHMQSISAYREGIVKFDQIYETFDTFIRPKLRSFFKGGLSRRIDAVVSIHMHKYLCIDCKIGI
jgi:hypothetical protein